MRCSVLHDRVAVWSLKKYDLKLSVLAAELLVEQKKMKWHDLRLVRNCDWNDFGGPGEPLTGGGAAIASSAVGVFKGVGSMPARWAKTLKRRERNEQKKKHRRKSSQVNRSLAHNGPKESNGYVKAPAGGELMGGMSEGVQKEARRGGALPNGTTNQLPEHAVDGEENEDNVSVGADGSQENIAQDLAEDTGHGLAKSGQALAKGELFLLQYFHTWPVELIAIHSTHGPCSSHRSRLPQRPTSLR